MAKVVITQEMLEDAKRCNIHRCDRCAMSPIKMSLNGRCTEALAAALDEERKLHGDTIKDAPLKAAFYRIYYFNKDSSCIHIGNRIDLPHKTPEDIVIEKHGDHVREILDEYKVLLDADK